MSIDRLFTLNYHTDARVDKIDEKLTKLESEMKTLRKRWRVVDEKLLRLAALVAETRVEAVETAVGDVYETSL